VSKTEIYLRFSQPDPPALKIFCNEKIGLYIESKKINNKKIAAKLSKNKRRKKVSKTAEYCKIAF